YELLIRDFLHIKNYQTLTDTLDYLERLGVNAIELMPVNEFDGNLSWGYNPSFHLALDKYYGSPEAFKTFVQEAHKRGMAVILDVVLNHATGLNPLYQLYGGSGNPYFNPTAKHDFNVFNDMNHEYSGTRYYSKRVMEYWLEEYKVDGYRFDLSKGFTQKNTLGNTGAWGQYDQSRVDIWKDYADAVWAVDSSAYVILEHFADNSEEKVLADYGMMLWGNMNHAYNEASMGYSSNLSGVLSESRGFADRHLVGYMESHDEQWLMFKNIAFGNSSGNYDITEWGTALGRQKLAGAFFFTLPGPKMMWQFGELGYGYGDNGEQCLNDADYCPSSAPGRTAEKPIRWDYYNNPDNPERVKLYKTWSALINLRRSSPAFTAPNAFSYDLEGTLKSITLEHADTDVVIAGNFGMNPTTMTVDFTATGTWYDFFEGTTIDVTELEHPVELGLGDFKIFTTKEFETPEEGLATSGEIEPDETALPNTFRLNQNYPNPFNPSTVISYQLAGNSEVTLEVFDMLGRKVSTLVNERKSAGSYQVNFDASNLSSGMYFYRLQAGG
ncbi:MAG: alpha-amylase family glycosyl hydrolase, partial [Balneolaceae bacterium]